MAISVVGPAVVESSWFDVLATGSPVGGGAIEVGSSLSFAAAILRPIRSWSSSRKESCVR